jgi:hypothetical protein
VQGSIKELLNFGRSSKRIFKQIDAFIYILVKIMRIHAMFIIHRNVFGKKKAKERKPSFDYKMWEVLHY